MMSKLRFAFAVVMVGTLAACHSGVKLDENANKGAGGSMQPNPNDVATVNHAEGHNHVSAGLPPKSNNQEDPPATAP